MKTRANKVPERLGDILMRTTRLDKAALDQAMQVAARSESRLGAVLVEQGVCTEEEVARGLAQQLHIPYLELEGDFRLTQRDVQQLPEALARRYVMFCIAGDGEDQRPELVMQDPTDIEALDAVRAFTQRDVEKAVARPSRIQELIDRFYREEAYIEENLQSIVDLEEEEEPVFANKVEADQLKIIANDAPVVRFVNLLLMEAVRDRASDIHFEPAEKSVDVRLRVDGKLKAVTPPPRNLYQAVVTRLKILSGMDIAERRLPQDGRFKYRTQEHEVDVRVSSVPLIYGEKVVLRILDRTGLNLDMEKIGFEPENLHRFQRILKMPHGIILLTGPTGSGKTSTLYGALNYLKDPELNIQTVEDPVEYHVDGINQMHIRPAVGLLFADALRSILRQDPDVIMIGEIRDLETAEIAIRAALTGHLVLSTLHTNDATSAFSRLVDIGAKSYLVAATVNLVISQRLVRTICSQCRESYQPPDDQMELLTEMDPKARQWDFQRGTGCKHCLATGYRGRTAVTEFLEVDRTIRELIHHRAGDLEIRQAALAAGMKTLVDNGLLKIKRGETTLDELLNVWPMDEAAFQKAAGHEGI